jgi:hypothetical protein
LDFAIIGFAKVRRLIYKNFITQEWQGSSDDGFCANIQHVVMLFPSTFLTNEIRLVHQQWWNGWDYIVK